MEAIDEQFTILMSIVTVALYDGGMPGVKAGQKRQTRPSKGLLAGSASDYINANPMLRILDL